MPLRGGIRTHNPSKWAAADPLLDRAGTELGEIRNNERTLFFVRGSLLAVTVINGDGMRDPLEKIWTVMLSKRERDICTLCYSHTSAKRHKPSAPHEDAGTTGDSAALSL